MAINKALQMVNAGLMLDIPKNIQQNNEGYLYPHDFGGYVDQEYLSRKLDIVELKDIGFEAKMKDWLQKIKTS
jgi:putative ATPase